MKKTNLLASNVTMPIIAIFCCLLWGSAFPSLKSLYLIVGADTIFDKILQAGIRFSIAGIMVLMFTSYYRSKQNSDKSFYSKLSALKLAKSAIPIVVIISLIQTYIGYSFYYIGIGNTSGVKASILVSMGIFIVVILSAIFIKGDRLNIKKIVGLILGITGIIIINMGNLDSINSSFSITGEGFLIISSSLMAITAIIIKIKANTIDPLLLNGWQLAIGGVLLIITGLIGGGSMAVINVSAILLILYLSLLSAVAFSVWFMMYKYHNPSTLAIFKFSVPIFGSLLSIMFLAGETMNIQMFIALIFVSIGIIVVNINMKKKAKSTI